MANVSNVLNETKLGQKGYVKEDVNNYVDELLAKIESLEKELEDYRTTDNPVEKIKKLEGVIESLNKQVKDTNDKLTGALRQHDEDEMRIQKLQKASKNGGYNPEMEKQLQEKDDEINSMFEKLEQVRDVLVDKDAEVASLTDEIQRLKDENQELTNTIQNNANAFSAESATEDSESKAEIERLNETISERDETIKSLQSEVDRLKAENEQLANVDEDDLAMTYAGNLIKGAKADAKNITEKAQAKADKTIAEAEELKASADEEVQKVLDKANEEAQATIDNANAQANEIITNAELESNDRAIAINAKAEQIEKDSQAFKSIIMEQIASVNESLASVMELINTASDKVSDAKEKLSNDEPLEELVANLPKAEVVEVATPTPVAEPENIETIETVDTPSANANVDMNIDGLDDLLKAVEDSAPEEEVEEESTQPTETSEFSMDGMDGLDDLLKAVEDSTPDEEVEEEQSQEVNYSANSSFGMDGLDDLLKAVEDSTPDEEPEDVTPEPIPSGSAFNMDGLDDLLKAVEDSTPDEEVEELSAESIPQPTLVDEGELASPKSKNESGSGSMEDLMRDMGASMSSLLEDLQ